MIDGMQEMIWGAESDQSEFLLICVTNNLF